jgi:2-succinyl-5-enolpyruvyl-6-hydroxy-3-cyclohexene-1-carboxylate synthase
MRPMAELDVSPQDVAATYCATLVDEWVRGGVTHACVAPGSRSTPLALALAADERLQVSVFHDERAASFAAVGIGRVTHRPAIVLTTSGTAAAELHAAVIEAHQAGVPMLVVTADRPPELRDVGAPQTIDQVKLFGGSVRLFVEPGVADWHARHTWRPLAAHALLASLGAAGAASSGGAVAAGPGGTAAGAARPGPVHCNLAFREPLLGRALPLPAGRPRNAPWARGADVRVDGGPVIDRSRPGLVVAGVGAARHGTGIRRLGWPVLADPRSGLGGVAHADPILRVRAFAERYVPETIVRVGDPPASRVVNEWLASTGATTIVIGDSWSDPSHTASVLSPTFTVDTTSSAPRAWMRAWMQADATAAKAIAAQLARSKGITEPGVVRMIIGETPRGGHVVVSSSMPVRDLEWYTPRRTDLTVHANRGANGIDGVVSTAIGVALCGAPTVALVGDLAFLHDSSALIALARRPLRLTIVVVDNDGGGIFSFLGQADELETDRFEQLFGTPHGTDCAGVARAHALRVVEAATPVALSRALARVDGVSVIVVKSDRAANVAVHRAINEAVRRALAPDA